MPMVRRASAARVDAIECGPAALLAEDARPDEGSRRLIPPNIRTRAVDDVERPRRRHEIVRALRAGNARSKAREHIESANDQLRFAHFYRSP